MKFSIVISVLPIVLSYSIYTAAYPVSGYNTDDLVVREALPADYEVVVARTELVDDLDARGFLSKVFHKKQPTAAEAEERKRRKIHRAESKFNKQVGKHIAKVAKIESGGGANHKVATKWKAGAAGEADMGHVSHKQAQKYWKENPHFQQYKHAEVSAQRKADGTIWTTARYHNGGSAFSGATAHIFTRRSMRST
ncbi:hypothetical protein BDN70DRAFT_925360 [Pholiota conissans]|uniref:Uncharacterized protein n=1 Tax=Pholiota conissans TaxID=109636 RepID=A0A9P5YQ59_9AGAR|nr:hypothetical protein BDN70DRAFT_925360 [Pholiota conissans]